MSDLSNYRKSYEKSELLETAIPNSPFDLFSIWFKEAEESKLVEEVNAMTISTIGLDGFPKSRVVLLKQFNEEGFTFFTNYNSEKGKAILNNPNVCVSFFWPALERQIIIKGKAIKSTSKVSDDYFSSRPKGSQLGAVVSNQSEVVTDRLFLEKLLSDFENKFENTTVNRPAHWGGFLIIPNEIEFWQGRPNRLHDRIRFKMNTSKVWVKERLAP